MQTSMLDSLIEVKIPDFVVYGDFNDVFPKLQKEIGNYKHIGIDTETTLFDKNTQAVTYEIKVIQLGLFSNVDKNADLVFVIPVDTPEQIKQITDLLKEKVLYFQNAKYDLKGFMHYGIYLDKGNTIKDTMIKAKVYNASQTGNYASKKVSLKDLLKKYLKIELDKGNQTSDWTTRPLTDSQVLYAALDVAYIVRLYYSMPSVPEQILYLEEGIIPILGKLEMDGVAFDSVMCNLMISEYKEEIATAFEVLENEIHNRVENYTQVALKDIKAKRINFISNKQMLNILNYFGLNLDNVQRETLTDLLKEKEVDFHIENIINAFLHIIDRQKEIGLLEGFLKNAKASPDNRVHAKFNQLGTKSGRMSSSNPNLQQIKKGKMRTLFYAGRDLKIIKADYSQMELRILAGLTGDKGWVKILSEGGDLHRDTASAMYHCKPEEVTKAQRNNAKGVNFGLIYGMGASSLAKRLGITPEEAHAHIEAFKKKNKKIGKYLNDKKDHVLIKTLYGREIYAETYMNKLNLPIQGTGADITKIALGMLWNKYFDDLLNDNVKLLNVVHDEINIGVTEDIIDKWTKILQATMEKAADFIMNKGKSYIKIPADPEIKDTFDK